MHTILSPDAFDTILAAYGLVAERVTALTEQGTINSNYAIVANDARYFLRLNEGKSDAQVAAEARIVSELHHRGVPTPLVIPTHAGALFSRHEQKQVTLFAWVEGTLAEALVPSVAAAAVAGHALGLLHRASRDLDSSMLPDNQYSPALLIARAESVFRRLKEGTVPPALAEGLFATVERLVGQFEAAAARVRTGGDNGLIHQDLFPDNVLVDGAGKLTALLDFEQATLGPRTYDVAVALNAWCWQKQTFDVALVAALLHAYETEVGHSLDRVALFAECRLAAARFALTRITDVHLRVDCPPALRARKDYCDFIARLEDLEQRRAI